MHIVADIVCQLFVLRNVSLVFISKSTLSQNIDRRHEYNVVNYVANSGSLKKCTAMTCKF